MPEAKDYYKQALEQRDFATSKVSELCRTFSFGILALCYAIVISDAEIPEKLRENYNCLILLMGSTASITLLLDYGQYYFARLQAENAIKNKDGNYRNNKSSMSAAMRSFCYSIKQFTTAISVIGLAIFSVMAFYLVTNMG